MIYILTCLADIDLTRIGERARKQPDLVFTSLYHRVTDLDVLRVELQRRGQKPKQFAFHADLHSIHRLLQRHDQVPVATVG